MALSLTTANTVEEYFRLLDILANRPEEVTGEMAELVGKNILCHIDEGNLLYYNDSPVTAQVKKNVFVDDVNRQTHYSYEFVLTEKVVESYEEKEDGTLVPIYAVDEDGRPVYKTVTIDEAELRNGFADEEHPFKLDIRDVENNVANLVPGILSGFDKFRLEVIAKMLINGTTPEYFAHVYDETALRVFESESGIERDDEGDNAEFFAAVEEAGIEKVDKEVYFDAESGQWRYDISDEDMKRELKWKVGKRVISESPEEMGLPNYGVVPAAEIELKSLEAEVFDLHNADYQIYVYSVRELTQIHGNLPQKNADGTNRTADDLKATYGTISNILNAILFGDPASIHIEIVNEPTCKLVPKGGFDPKAVKPGDAYPSASQISVEFVPGLCRLVNGDGTPIAGTDTNFGVEVSKSAWIYDMHKDYDRHGRIENDFPYKIIENELPYGPEADDNDHLDYTIAVNDSCVYFGLVEFEEIPATVVINDVEYALPSANVGKTGMYTENAWCFGDAYDRMPYRRMLPATDANAERGYEDPDKYPPQEAGYHYFSMDDLYTYPCIWANVNPEDISVESLYDSKNVEPVAYVENAVPTSVYPEGDGMDVFVKWPSATSDEQRFEIWTPANFRVVSVTSAHDTFYGMFNIPVVLPGKDDAFELILNEDGTAEHQITDNGVSIDYHKYSIGKVPGITVVKIRIEPKPIEG